MTASDEPPVIDTLGAIERGSVLGILSEADKILATKQLAERQSQAINEIRAMHTPMENSMSALYPEPQCRGCSEDHPCTTIAILHRLGA